MKTRDGIGIWSAVCLAGIVALNGRADTHYVSPSGGNQSPYTNGWSSASQDIQSAVNAAAANDTVLVNEGTYNLTSQIVVSAAITLQSLNGRDATFINGGYPAYSNRCLKVNNVNAIVDGFTITNGYFVITGDTEGEYGGGGVMLYNMGTLRNCVVAHNTCYNPDAVWNNHGGGGIFVNRGSGVISNCIVRNNTCLGAGHQGGGGILLLAPDAAAGVFDSAIISNVGPATADNRCGGGGIFAYGGTVSDCDIVGNQAYLGGGVYPRTGATIRDVRMAGNSATKGGGVGGNIGTAWVRDCIISNNTASLHAGGVFVDYGGNFSNCVIVANSAYEYGGVYAYGGQPNSKTRFVNCVVAGNSAPNRGGM
ncbi:MAG: hypothetical protein PHR35_18725 [Kiritimatiellae bacterium]|nr:hypothetical protein [Kiritimatiellia bacterium]